MLHTKEADVVVLGGGPAGCAVALGLARQRCSVAVIERSDYVRTRIGETLPPMTRKIMADLGIWDRFVSENHLPSFGMRSVWGGDEIYEYDFIFNPYGAGWHVDRARFDAMLARCAEEAGATVYREAHLLSCENGNSRNWKVEIAVGNQRHSIRTKFLVDATGRASFAARKQGARRITWDRLIGLISFFSLPSQEPIRDNSTLIEAVEDGWWYSAALPDSRMVLAYMTDADLYNRERKQSGNYFRQQMESTKHTRARVTSYVLASAPRIVAANSSRLDFVAGRNWLAVGDAAMAFDPLSGQGVYKALELAARATRTIQEHWTGNVYALGDYAMAADRAFNHYLLKRRAFYALEHRFPHSIFWQRRISWGREQLQLQNVNKAGRGLLFDDMNEPTAGLRVD